MLYAPCKIMIKLLFFSPSTADPLKVFPQREGSESDYSYPQLVLASHLNKIDQMEDRHVVYSEVDSVEESRQALGHLTDIALATRYGHCILFCVLHCEKQ